MLLRVSRPTTADDLAPGVTIMLLAHDDWCAYFRGDDCSCDPDITYRRVDDATLQHPASPGEG